MNKTTKQAIKESFLAIEAGAQMTASIKTTEYTCNTINNDTLEELNRSIGSTMYELQKECPGNRSEFLAKYNIVSKNGPLLVTFWVEIFPKNWVKSGKVSEIPGKTPNFSKKDRILGVVLGKVFKSRNRDYFSAPVNTRNYHLNSFPSCAGLVDSVIKIDNRPKKADAIYNS